MELQNGTVLRAERDDYQGFHTKPFDWNAARAKFDRVTDAFTTAAERAAIAEVIAAFEERPVAALTSLLGELRAQGDRRMTSSTEPRDNKRDEP